MQNRQAASQCLTAVFDQSNTDDMACHEYNNEQDSDEEIVSHLSGSALNQ